MMAEALNENEVEQYKFGVPLIKLELFHQILRKRRKKKLTKMDIRFDISKLSGKSKPGHDMFMIFCPGDDVLNFYYESNGQRVLMDSIWTRARGGQGLSFLTNVHLPHTTSLIITSSNEFVPRRITVEFGTVQELDTYRAWNDRYNEDLRGPRDEGTETDSSPSSSSPSVSSPSDEAESAAIPPPQKPREPQEEEGQGPQPQA